MDLPSRIPPHSLDMEHAVLGAVLLEGALALPKLVQLLRPADFYTDAHRAVYEGMLALFDRGEPVDLLTLQEELRRTDQLEFVGGPAALALLMEQGSVAVYLQSYATVVKNMAVLRGVIQTSTQLIGMAFDAKDDPGPLLVDAEEKIAALLERVSTRPDDAPARVGMVAANVVEMLDTPETGFISSPIPQVNDRLGGGALPGEVIILGGRPGTAKTALALQWFKLAGELGTKAIFFSLEMKRQALARRVLAQHARVSAMSLRKRKVNDEERRLLLRSIPHLTTLPLTLDDTSYTIGQIRQAVRQGGYRFVVIDYIQLVRSPRDAGDGRRLEVTAISRALKEIARRYDCVVLALSSLTRLHTDRGKKLAPAMDSLKESGDIEHDADVVLLLHRPKDDSSDRELIFGKVREGESGGSVTLNFQPIYVTFDEVSSREPGDEPPF